MNDVKIRLSLDGADATASGMGRVGTAVALSADEVLRLDKAAAAAAVSQAKLDTATLSAAKAQEAFAKASNDILASQGKVADLAARAATAQAAQAAAAVKAREGAAALKALQDAHAGVTGATKVNAYQTAQLSAQLQDLFVQIQAGQAPLTALLQQGSQLSAVFGGGANALKAIGSLITPTVAVYGSLAAAVGAVALAYHQGSAEQDAYVKGLVLSGNAAGTTTGQLKELARAQAAVVGTQGKAADVLAQLAATGNVSAQVFGKATDAAIRLERVGGGAIEDTVKKFDQLGRTPLQALVKLNEAENFLTKTLYDQVRALEVQGKTQEAATLAQSAYADIVASRGKAIEAQLGTLQKAWKGVGDFAKGAWDAMLNVGRPDTLEDQLKKAQQRLEDLQRSASTDRSSGRRQSTYQGQIDGQKQLIANLGELIRLDQRAAEADKARSDAAKKLDEDRNTAIEVAAARAQAVFAQTAAKIKGDIDEIKSLGNLGLLSPIEAFEQAGQKNIDLLKAEKVQYQALLAIAKDKLKNDAQVATLNGQIATKNIEIANAEVAAQYAVAEAIYARQKAAEAAYRAEQQEGQAAIDALNNRLGAILSQAVDQQLDYARSVRDSNEYLQLEASLIGATDRARSSALEKLRIEIDLRQQLERLRRTEGLSPADRERLAGQYRDEAAKASAQADARAAQEEYQRVFTEVRSGIYDAIFHGGSDGWKRLARVIENTVLRPTIEAAFNPIAGSITSAITGVSPAGSALNSASSLASLYSSGSAFSGLFSSNAAYGAAIGTTNVAAGSQAALLAEQTGGFGAAGAVATSEAAAGASAGASEMIAAFGPYALGALALYAAFSDHSKFSLGSVATGKFDLSGLFQATNTDAPFAFGNNTEHDRPAALGNLLASAGASISAAAAVFGGSAAGLSLTANTDLDRKGKAAGILALLLNGQRVAGVQTGTGAFAGNDPGNAAKIDAAQLSEFFANAVPTLIVEALQKSDLPQRFQDYFGSIDLQGLTTEKAQAVLATAQAVKTVTEEMTPLGTAFGQFSTLSVDSVTKFVAAAGGLDTLNQSLAGYVQNFYSDGERTAMTLGAIGDQLSTLGLQLPTTREGYRALVEAQDRNTDSGLKATAMLLNLEGAFAEVVPATGALAEVMKTAAEVMDERRGLEDQLLQLQGKTTDLREREREQLDPSNRALYDRIQALKDEQAAAQRAAEALKSATEALKNNAAAALAAVERAVQAQKDALAAKYNSDISTLDAQASAARAAYDAIIKGLDAAREAARAAYDAQVAEIRAAQDALDAQAKAQAKAYSEGVAAIADERKAAQTAYRAASDQIAATIRAQTDSVSKLRGLSESLTSTLKALRPIGSEASDRVTAQRQISQALATARSTGALPDAANLRDALSTIAKPSQDLFGSFTDYARDFYRTQLDIRDLSDIAGEQLDGAQAQLDATIAMKDALDAANEANLTRLDGLREALDLANDQAREQIELQRAALSGRLDAARAGLDGTLSGLDSQAGAAKALLDAQLSAIDTQKEALKAEFDRQIKALDDLLSVAKDQYNALLRIDTSVQPVADALAALTAALTALALGTGQTPPTGAPSTPLNQWVTSGNVQTYVDPNGAIAVKTTGQSGLDASVQGKNAAVFTVQDIVDFVAPRIQAGDFASIMAKAAEVGISSAAIDDALQYTRGTFDALSKGGLIAGFSVADVRAFVQARLAEGDPKAVYDRAVGLGITSHTLDAILGWKDGTALDWALKNGLPAFAGGGAFDGGLRIVGERGPELEATGAARIFSFDQLMNLAGGKNRDETLVAEIRELRAEVAKLRSESRAGQQAIAVNTGAAARTLKNWDGNGQPPVREDDA